MDIATEGEYLCLLICSGAIGVCDPFLIPFVERSVLLAKRMHGLRGRHLGFDRDEVCLEGRAEVIPTAKVGTLESKGGLLSISGPFTGRGAKFEMSQGTSDALCYEPVYPQLKHRTMKSSYAFKWTQIHVICALWICFLNLELFLVLAIDRRTA